MRKHSANRYDNEVSNSFRVSKGGENIMMNATSRLSMKQASAIELASQKQSKSISKLQSRLRQNESSFSRFEKPTPSKMNRFAASTTTNDYIDMTTNYQLNNSRDQKVKGGYSTNNNFSVPRIPQKAVKITSGSGVVGGEKLLASPQ